MKSNCVMCGREIAGGGILCDKCDKPRKPKPEPVESRPESRAAAPAAAPAVVPAPAKAPVRAPLPEPPPPEPVSERASMPETSGQMALDPFPKAPIVPFPVETTTLGMTSLCEVLATAKIPSLLVSPDRMVRFVSEEARQLFKLKGPPDAATLKTIESRAGVNLADVTRGQHAKVSLEGKPAAFSLIPLSGGAGGSVMIFRVDEVVESAGSSLMSYVRETVINPLRALQEALLAGAQTRKSDPLLEDAASTVDQILSSLELSPALEEPVRKSVRPRVMTVREVLDNVAAAGAALAKIKGVTVQVDAPDTEMTFRDHEHLADAMTILVENSFHYVPSGGQIVVGVRMMDHKGKALLLFFVMDNGPRVPEEIRTSIFENEFEWDPKGAERTGRGLSRCREFAQAHSGQVWVESKTGKACTFFIRVRPDE